MDPSRTRRRTDLLRTEAVGGALLLVAAVVALVWANSPAQETYHALRETQLGPLTLEKWAADGLLSIFFFVAGLELKRELVVGTLSRPADALVPLFAAVAGMVVPAGIYLAVNAQGGRPEGWAIPMATDIAFALAVLAVFGRGLPTALRAFLLTLAVVDDLGAILVIAVAFTTDLSLVDLAVSAALLAGYGLLQQRRVERAVVYLPLAVGAWWFMHESGVHATIAGVTLGLLTRVRRDTGEAQSPAERYEHRFQPLSSGFAVPLFALAAAGVTLSGGLGAFAHPAAVGIAVGLVVGKTVGVYAGALLATTLTRARLHPDLGWLDIGAVGVLSGVGFTVSLLITELAFEGELVDTGKAAVLAGSLVAAVAAAVLLRTRTRQRRRLAEAAAASGPPPFRLGS